MENFESRFFMILVEVKCSFNFWNLLWSCVSFVILIGGLSVYSRIVGCEDAISSKAFDFIQFFSFDLLLLMPVSVQCYWFLTSSWNWTCRCRFFLALRQYLQLGYTLSTWNSRKIRQPKSKSEKIFTCVWFFFFFFCNFTAHWWDWNIIISVSCCLSCPIQGANKPFLLGIHIFCSYQLSFLVH